MIESLEHCRAIGHCPRCVKLHIDSSSPPRSQSSVTLLQQQDVVRGFVSSRRGERCAARRSMGLFNWLVHRVIDQVFNQVDYNNDGRLEALEIEIAILKVYNIINKRLPGWQNPPTRKQIQTALSVFDVDGNGALDRWEFYEFTKSMTQSGPDTFFKRVGTSAVMRTAFIPGMTHLLQRAARQSGHLDKFGNAPLAVLAPALGVIGGTIRGFLPGI